MDFWVVAAAAGAGYLAKFLQNNSQKREGSSETPSVRSLPDGSKPSSLIQETCQDRNESHIVGIFAETLQGDSSLQQKTTCISALENENQGNSNVPSSSELREKEKFKHRDSPVVNSNDCEMTEYPTREMGESHCSVRRKNPLRRKHLNFQFINPRSSLDSCLVAQMYREDAEIEDYLLSPLASPCTPCVSPFIVTDGTRVISRASGDFKSELHKAVRSKANVEVIGVPSLPRFGEADYSKVKQNKSKSWRRKSSYTSTSGQFESQVSASGQVFFSFGMSIGIMCTIIANKLEVEKLKESLMQTENLVEDLQEELEMKDSLTVKELINDDDLQDAHENWFRNKALNMLSGEVDKTLSIKFDDEQSVSLKEAKSISKIEAELEAELERLEQSMKGSAVRGRLSDVIEFDQDSDEDDIIAELVHGELNPDIIRQRSSSELSPDRDSSSSPSTPFSAKQGVSPYELSLRLHEVIESRLEHRIKELELQLANSQKRVQYLEAERFSSWRENSHSESSSTWGSPITIEAHSPMVMSLSRDALDAYNESFEEFDKLKECRNGHSHLLVKNEHERTLSNQNGFRDCGSTCNEGRPNGDDINDLLLIKQIVEKARQGSPAVLKAQRALVCMNRKEN